MTLIARMIHTDGNLQVEKKCSRWSSLLILSHNECTLKWKSEHFVEAPVRPGILVSPPNDRVPVVIKMAQH